MGVHREYYPIYHFFIFLSLLSITTTTTTNSPNRIYKNFVFSESQLEKENKNGQCCEFLKVESGLTYAGIYRLVKGIRGLDWNWLFLLIRTKNGYWPSPREDSTTKIPKTSVNGHVEYVLLSSDSKQTKEEFTIKYGGFSVHGTGWYILAKAGGGLCWQLKGEMA